MNASTKLFSCLGCKKAFSGKDAKGFPTQNFPYLLQCGHSLCSFCIKSSTRLNKDIICPECQLTSKCPVGKDDQFKDMIPDLYALGVLANFGRRLSANFNYLLERPAENQSKRRLKSVSSNTQTTCDVCTAKADWRCDQCVQYFCSKCFNKAHLDDKVFKKHKAKPLMLADYRSIMQRGCPHHDNKCIEYYCEDDSQLVCSHCIVTGSHKGHNAVTVMDKNITCMDSVREAKIIAVKVKKQLQFTEKKISSMKAESNFDDIVPKMHKQVETYFHDLHSFLQLKEIECLASLEQKANQSKTGLETLLNKVQEDLLQVTALLADTNQLLNNSYTTIDSVSLIKYLNMTKGIQGYLVPTTERTEDTLKLNLNQNYKTVIQKLVTIDSNITPKYILAAEHELPENFQHDDLEEVNTTDTESISGSTVSDDLTPKSINGIKAPISGLKAPISSIVKPTRIKPAHSDSVMVTHIKSPSCFYVQRVQEALKFQDVSTALNKFCNLKVNKKFIPKSISMGEMYLAKYNQDGSWYRARVKEIELVDPPPPKKKGVKKSRKRVAPSFFEDVDDEDDSESTLDSNSSKSIITSNNSSSDSATSEDDGYGFDASSVKEGPKTSCLVNNNTEVKILFVDFGNTEMVKVSNLRQMQKQFMRMPSQALECCLWEITPNGKEWSHDSIKLFAKFTGNKAVNMKIMDEIGDVLHVDLIHPIVSVSTIENDSPVSVREALVFLDRALFTNPQNSVNSLRRYHRNAQHFLFADPLIAGVKMSVVVSNVENPTMFFVQIVNSTTRYFSMMQADIQQTYTNYTGEADLNVYSPIIGHPYIALFPEDTWYRVTAVGLPGNAKVAVFSVDFGHTEVIDCDRLKKITDHFLKLPGQAIQCCLADVGPLNNWSTKTLDWFKSKSKQDLNLVVYKNSPSLGYVVSLYEAEELSDLSLNVQIVEGGLARSVGAASVAPNRPRNLVVQNTQKIKGLLPLPPPLLAEQPNPSSSSPSTLVPVANPPKVNKKTPFNPVRVTYFESPALFYIQIVSAEVFKSLKKELKDFYNKSSAICKKWEIEEACVVLNVEKKEWCRGKIKKIIDSENYEVYYFDYGFSHNVNSDNLRVLHRKFTEEKSLAHQCHLGGINPAGDTKKWTAQATEKVQKKLNENSTMLFLGKKADVSMHDSLAVDLLIREIIPGGALDANMTIYHSISEFLLSEGLALPDRKRTKVSSVSTENECQNNVSQENVFELAQSRSPTLPPPSIPLPEVESAQLSEKWLPVEKPDWSCKSAVPSYIGYDGCIYLHTCGEMETTLNSMSKAFGEIFESRRYRAPKEVVREGLICIAKFFHDLKWYRGKIIKVHATKVEVFFVDYGNIILVNLEDIRTQIAFKEIPVQCYECELHNIRPVSENGQWLETTLDFINDQIVDKVSIVYIEEPPTFRKRLQVSITLAGGVSLVDILVERGLARRIRAAPQGDLLVTRPGCIPNYKTLPLPEIGVPFPVSTTFVTEEGQVFFQRLVVDPPITADDHVVNTEHTRFLTMMTELTDNAHKFDLVEEPIPGTTYCVQFSYDDAWYRGLVAKVTGGWASILYIDYGNPEDIPLNSNRIRLLPDHYLNYPRQSFVCTLYGVVPTSGGWDKELMQDFVNLASNWTDDGLILAEIKAGADQPILECEFYQIIEQENEISKVVLAYQSLLDSGLISKFA